MLRYLAPLALLAIFMMMSPSLRESLAGIAEQGQTYMAANSPISYIVLVVATLAGLFLMLKSGVQPR